MSTEYSWTRREVAQKCIVRSALTFRNTVTRPAVNSLKRCLYTVRHCGSVFRNSLDFSADIRRFQSKSARPLSSCLRLDIQITNKIIAHI